MFWALLGDMSGFPRLGVESEWGFGGDARPPAAMGRKHRTISGCYGIPDAFIVIVVQLTVVLYLWFQ